MTDINRLAREIYESVYQRVDRDGEIDDHTRDSVIMPEIEHALQQARQQVIDRMPDSWLHPLLTGPRQVLGAPPYTGQDIERLLIALKKELEAS